MLEFLKYLEQSIEDLKAEEKDLVEKDRKDEANFARIKMNIYGIAKTYYDVVKKSCGETDFVQNYLKKISVLPKNWETSYEKAKEHQDVENIVVEELKLQTLETILNKIQEVSND